MSGLFRGDGLLLRDVDFTCAVPAERYECQTCSWRGQLTTNGRCGFCGSASVMPTAVIDNTQAAIPGR